MHVVAFAGVEGALVAVAEHEFDGAEGVAVAGFEVVVGVLFVALGGVAGEGAQDEAGVGAEGDVVADADAGLAFDAAFAALVLVGAFEQQLDHVHPGVVERDAGHQGDAAACPGVVGAGFDFVFDAELGLAGFGVVGEGRGLRQQDGQAGGPCPGVPPGLRVGHGRWAWAGGGLSAARGALRRRCLPPFRALCRRGTGAACR